MRRNVSFAVSTAAALSLVVIAACNGGSDNKGDQAAVTPAPGATSSSPAASPSASAAPTPSTVNLYAAAGANMFSPAVADAKALVYVPNHTDGTISVIDPKTYTVIDTYASGPGTQHVVPSWDMKTLYGNNTENGNSLTPIDPTTGKRKGPNIPVDDPYNMYYTPDGKYAIVVAEALKRLDFRDPQTYALKFSIQTPQCTGVNHIDFAADLKTMVATCEFAGKIVKINLEDFTVMGYLDIGKMPQDIKIDPTGSTYYIADMDSAGVFTVDAATFTKTGYIPTGPEAHGLYPSRDSKSLYVANRGGANAEGSVSVIDFATQKVVARWALPGGGTPDMGNVSADGTEFWLSGRRSGVVYVWDTRTGTLTHKIKVGNEPHGLCVWPQPGKYSLGHTGITR